jgi:IclR family transcriptional regulator, KDG regulon repressor
LKTNRSILRGLSVIEALADGNEGLGLAQLADRSGLDKGTATRLLRTLEEAGYVRRDAELKRYSLTSRIIQVANRVGYQIDLRKVALTHLRELRDTTNEIVHLGVIENDLVVYIEKLEPNQQALQIITGVGQTMPVHSTSLGKSILANLPPLMRDAMIDRLDFAQATKKTIADPASLVAELDQIRAQGFALDNEENMDAVSCIAAPVFDKNGDVLAAVSCTLPSYRITDGIAPLARAVRAAADRISKDLGTPA